MTMRVLIINFTYEQNVEHYHTACTQLTCGFRPPRVVPVKYRVNGALVQRVGPSVEWMALPRSVLPQTNSQCWHRKKSVPHAIAGATPILVA